jgi:hypothetical protein
MREDAEVFRELNHAKALQQPQGRHGGIEIQAGGKASAQDEAKGFKRVHIRAEVPASSPGGPFQGTTKGSGMRLGQVGEESKRPGQRPGRLEKVDE